MRDICTGSKRSVDMAERTGRGVIADHTPYASIIPPTVNLPVSLRTRDQPVGHYKRGWLKVS